METERARFVLEAELSDLSHAELCRRHNISRPTGYLWLRRYRAEGLDGLKSRSHRPASCAHVTSPEVVARILAIRDKRGWGARKIRKKLVDDPAIEVAPSTDTVNRILRREGRITPSKPRRRREHAGPPIPILPEPNGTWTADFKGEFRTQDGKLCFPLTVQDGYSRFLLECRALLSTEVQATMRRFRHLFRTFGLPRRIRSDNGPPFASTAIAGLSQLSVWWISLGITPELIEPGKPQQNGRHERMHRTLKEDATLPPRANLRAQQSCFNDFRRVYNHDRPHEALNMETPSMLYSPSPRPFTDRPGPLEYPAHFELRRVSGDCTLRWKSRKVFVSSLLKHDFVALEQIAEDVWSVFYGPVHLGWLDEADYRIMDVKERSRRTR